MTRTRQTLCSVAAAVLVAASTTAAFGDEPELALYEARYEVEYKGRRVGITEFSLDYDAASDTYVFESRTTAKGLARLLRPNTAIERSRFIVDDGTIRPVAFRFEDGSRKGEDNVDIAFDWQAGTASVDSDAGVHELALRPGVLDRGSLQAALMHDLSRRRDPGPYVLVDDDALKTYRYTIGEMRTIETTAGSFESVALTQEREGSSRTTRLWVAPSLNYLPVRIEQYRDGEVQTSLTLEAIDS